jgi:penicillin-insensitive murein DD-endopeptidase
MTLHSFLLSTLIALVFSSNSFAGSSAHDWAKITTPTDSHDGGQSIGSYNSGCVSGAVALPLEGTGYQVMRLSRKRYYGHQNLIQFIQQLGNITASEKIGTLLIGDLGQPRGGPTLSGHRSHQTGLDVDIWFLMLGKNNNFLLSSNERESWSAPSMVDMRSDTISDLWSPTHEKVLEIAARQPEVARIFVNPSIKRELCNHKTDTSGEWLRKIRPWSKHNDHFHVRLKCPEHNRQCDEQEPLPEGDGCDASLAWWFTAEAKSPAKNKPEPPPPLPELCQRVLND